MILGHIFIIFHLVQFPKWRWYPFAVKLCTNKLANFEQMVDVQLTRTYLLKTRFFTGNELFSTLVSSKQSAIKKIKLVYRALRKDRSLKRV